MATVYQTSHFSQEQISHLKRSANKQETTIARIFFKGYPEAFSPSDIHSRVSQWPITSVRRAITNLTQDGILEKTDKVREGKHGRPERLWKWRRPTGKQQLIFDQKI